jgi:hypothetical protein
VEIWHFAANSETPSAANFAIKVKNYSLRVASFQIKVLRKEKWRRGMELGKGAPQIEMLWQQHHRTNDL